MTSDDGSTISAQISHQQADSATLAVLVSGGLDSAILLGESLSTHTAVYPLYVRHGLFWETAELASLQRFLQAVGRPVLRPLHILDMPVADLYGQHWSITGCQVPPADSSDEAVYLPGRNVLLVAKAMLWCHLHHIPVVALAPLESNPFPDATPAFFAGLQAAVNQGIGGQVAVLRPYAELTKTEVMRRGQGFPVHLTFSCVHPVGEHHCGVCNKCAERRRAFADAGMPDPTDYHQEILS